MKKNMWVLLDDRMGSIGQAKGIVQALENKLKIEEKHVVYNSFAKLPNWIKSKTLLGLNKDKSSSLTYPYPDLVLSISRRTTPIARYIKKKSGGKTKIIQLMHPGKTGLNELDLVIIPRHDDYKATNDKFFFITGCIHRVSDNKIKEAQEKWQKSFAHLPRPWTSVIIGGAIRGKPFSLENAKALAQNIKKIQQKIGGSILITTSRRTGANAQNEIMNNLQGIPAYTFLWGDKAENPFMGFLACADKHIVTGDSVSMCSENCGTGKPVLIFSGKNWLTKKHLRFVQSLIDGGYATSIEDENAINFIQSQRLDYTPQIVKQILEL